MKEMLDSGLITQDDYDAKKKEYIYQCTLDNNPLLKSNYWFVKNIDLDIKQKVSFFSDFSQLRFVKITSYETEVN